MVDYVQRRLLFESLPASHAVGFGIESSPPQYSQKLYLYCKKESLRVRRRYGKYNGSNGILHLLSVWRSKGIQVPISLYISNISFCVWSRSGWNMTNPHSDQTWSRSLSFVSSSRSEPTENKRSSTTRRTALARWPPVWIWNIHRGSTKPQLRRRSDGLANYRTTRRANLLNGKRTIVVVVVMAVVATAMIILQRWVVIAIGVQRIVDIDIDIVDCYFII